MDLITPPEHQYQKVAKVSRATATRHLSQLVAMGCLLKTDAGGRSTRYVILLPLYGVN
jgi:Fic family protein